MYGLSAKTAAVVQRWPLVEVPITKGPAKLLSFTRKKEASIAWHLT